MHLETAWNMIQMTVSKLEEISTHRFVHTDPMSPIRLHTFADASSRAYGACVYIRRKTAEG